MLCTPIQTYQNKCICGRSGYDNDFVHGCKHKNSADLCYKDSHVPIYPQQSDERTFPGVLNHIGCGAPSDVFGCHLFHIW